MDGVSGLFFIVSLIIEIIVLEANSIERGV